MNWFASSAIHQRIVAALTSTKFGEEFPLLSRILCVFPADLRKNITSSVQSSDRFGPKGYKTNPNSDILSWFSVLLYHDTNIKFIQLVFKNLLTKPVSQYFRDGSVCPVSRYRHKISCQAWWNFSTGVLLVLYFYVQNARKSLKSTQKYD